MSKAQVLVVGVALVAFVAMYWGLDYRPVSVRAAQPVSTLGLASTSAQVLINESIGALSPQLEAEIHGYEKMLSGATSDARRIEVLKDLSGAWYRAGNPALAGHYAEEIAELSPSDTTWGMAGTTYTLCLSKDSLSAKQKAFCEERAVPAYENAISLAPEVNTHKVNLALHFTNNPPAENPMRGIRMLLDMNKENPEDVTVLVQLGRLSLQTNQNDKAVARLRQATALEPTHRVAQCLLAEAAQRVGNSELVAQATEACQRLRESNIN